MRFNVRQGKDLLDMVSKVLLFIVFAIMIVGLFIPEGKGLPLMFGGVMLFFVFPLIESFLVLYHKWLYRNIVIGEGYIDEEPDLWEKFKIRIIKVIPFKELPKILHEAYLNDINTYYTEQIRDNSLDEINIRFAIDEKTLETAPIIPIDYEQRLELENKQKTKKTRQYLDEEEEEETDE